MFVSISNLVLGNEMDVAKLDTCSNIIFKNEFLIFQKDTFNRVGADGQIHGNGLVFYYDTLKLNTLKVKHIIQSETDKFNTHKINDTPLDDTIINENHTQISCFVVGKGIYKNGKKDGVWFFSSKKDINFTDAKVTYVDGVLTSILCYTDSEQKLLYLKAVFSKGDWLVEWLNPKTNNFERKIEGVNMIKDVYYIP